ncbi:unnamed protein product [Symbiodinium sp. CCMP2592]|nr:unnamed protein product [Symbiodinium sp. CCMP2592]
MVLQGCLSMQLSSPDPGANKKKTQVPDLKALEAYTENPGSLQASALVEATTSRTTTSSMPPSLQRAAEVRRTAQGSAQTTTKLRMTVGPSSASLVRSLQLKTPANTNQKQYS